MSLKCICHHRHQYLGPERIFSSQSVNHLHLASHFSEHSNHFFFSFLPKKFNLLNHLIFIRSSLLLPQWLKLVSGHCITRVLHFTRKADCWTVKKRKKQYVEHALPHNVYDGSFCTSWLLANSLCLRGVGVAGGLMLSTKSECKCVEQLHNL